MRSLRVMFVAMISALCVSASSLYAEETKVSGYASVDVMSNYVWRGQKLANSWVVQPSTGISYGGFSANIWANYDSDREEVGDTDSGHGEFTETDVTVSYSFPIEKFSFDAGCIYYALEGANDTQEVYLSVGYDTILSPTLTAYYDYDEGQGAFIVASIGHSLDLVRGMSLELGASASYNIENKVMGVDSEGDEFSDFYNGEVSASVSIPVWRGLSIGPMIAYSFPLSNDAKDALEAISDDGNEDVFYGGINVGLSF